MNADRKTPAGVLLSLCAVVLGLIAVVAGDRRQAGSLEATGPAAPQLPPDGGTAAVEAAFRERAQGARLHVRGRVKSLLPESSGGEDGQRFVLELEGARTLLVVLERREAPAFPLRVGDEVELTGEYAWNRRGGELRHAVSHTSVESGDEPVSR